MTLALPLTSVVAVVLDNVVLAPLPGAANVTVAPGTGLLPASRTCTCNALANGVLILALCGEPPITVIFAGAPGVLVRAKLAAAATPATVAATV